jgi:hypothetical protein
LGTLFWAHSWAQTLRFVVLSVRKPEGKRGKATVFHTAAFVEFTLFVHFLDQGTGAG